MPREAPVIRQVDLRRACFEEAKSFRDRVCVGYNDDFGRTLATLNFDDVEEKMRLDMLYRRYHTEVKDRKAVSKGDSGTREKRTNKTLSLGHETTWSYGLSHFPT